MLYSDVYVKSCIPRKDDITHPITPSKMPRQQGAPRRVVFAIISASLFLGFFFVAQFRNLAQGTRDPEYIIQHSASAAGVDVKLLNGHAIAPKLGNETVKYVR